MRIIGLLTRFCYAVRGELIGRYGVLININSDIMKIDELTPTSTMLDELGRRLARARKEQDLSQPELAELAGIGVATLRRIETGSGGQLETWLKLLKALGMTSQIEMLLPETLISPMSEIGRKPSGCYGGGPARPLWGDERK